MKKNVAASAVISLVICVVSAFGIPLALQTTQHALVAGLFLVYLLATNVVILVAIFRLRAKGGRYIGTLTVLATIALAIAFMWAVLGAYFIAFATHGVSSHQGLVLDMYLRRGLAFQRIFLILIALWGIWRRAKVDAALATTLAVVVVLFTVASQSMSF